MSAHALILEPFETLAFMRAALVACVALALANGAIGTLLVLRRMSPRWRRARTCGDARRGRRVLVCGTIADMAVAGWAGERSCRGGSGWADYRRAGAA